MPSTISGQVTIMVPPPRPSLDLSRERRYLKDRIAALGLPGAVEELLEDYYSSKDDTRSLLARNREQATKLFSRSELKYLIAQEMYSVLGAAMIPDAVDQ